MLYSSRNSWMPKLFAHLANALKMLWCFLNKRTQMHQVYKSLLATTASAQSIKCNHANWKKWESKLAECCYIFCIHLLIIYYPFFCYHRMSMECFDPCVLGYCKSFLIEMGTMGLHSVLLGNSNLHLWQVNWQKYDSMPLHFTEVLTYLQKCQQHSGLCSQI